MLFVQCKKLVAYKCLSLSHILNHLESVHYHLYLQTVFCFHCPSAHNSLLPGGFETKLSMNFGSLCAPPITSSFTGFSFFNAAKPGISTELD